MDNKWTNDIRRLWSIVKWLELDPAHRMAEKIEECACFFRKKATEIRKEMKEKLQRMQWILASMQRLREQYPNNVWIEARLEEGK